MQQATQHVRIRINPRDPSARQALRKRSKPPLRLPLVRVRSPDRLVAVDGFDPDDDVRVFGDEELGEEAVFSGDGSPEWEHDVLPGSVAERSKERKWKEKL